MRARARASYRPVLIFPIIFGYHLYFTIGFLPDQKKACVFRTLVIPWNFAFDHLAKVVRLESVTMHAPGELKVSGSKAKAESVFGH